MKYVEKQIQFVCFLARKNSSSVEHVLYCTEVTCSGVFIGIMCSLSPTYALKQLNSARLEGDSIMVNFSYMLNFLHVKWLKVCWPTVFSTSSVKCLLLLLAACRNLNS